MGGGGKASDAASDVRSVGDIKLLARAVTGIELKDLRSLADEGKKQVGSGVVAIVGLSADGKAGIVVGVTDDLTKRFNAVDLVKRGAEALGGKGGGGRPTWRRPAVRTAPRPTPPSRRSRRRWAGRTLRFGIRSFPLPSRERVASAKRERVRGRR